MKVKITIYNQNKDIIFQGKPTNLPIKNESIQKKSIELFDDEEPCIIHQSYAIQKLIDGFLQEFKDREVNEMKFMDIQSNFDFIDIDNIANFYLTIKR